MDGLSALYGLLITVYILIGLGCVIYMVIQRANSDEEDKWTTIIFMLVLLPMTVIFAPIMLLSEANKTKVR